MKSTCANCALKYLIIVLIGALLSSWLMNYFLFAKIWRLEKQQTTLSINHERELK